MARLIQFPLPVIQPGGAAARCGRTDSGIPVHVWLPKAERGDRCVCGDQQLAVSAYVVDEAEFACCR